MADWIQLAMNAVVILALLLFRRHQHTWELVGVSKADHYNAFGHRDEHATSFLYRCPCGETKTSRRGGTWKLDGNVLSSGDSNG